MPKTDAYGSTNDPADNPGTVTVGLTKEEGDEGWDTKTSLTSSEKPAKKSATKKSESQKPAQTTEHPSKK